MSIISSDSFYSEDVFWRKVGRYIKDAGKRVIMMALVLHYTARAPSTPMWAKKVIHGVLVYFIVPVDLIPDFIPFAGFADDFGVLALAIATVAYHVNDESKVKAREKYTTWFRW